MKIVFGFLKRFFRRRAAAIAWWWDVEVGEGKAPVDPVAFEAGYRAWTRSEKERNPHQPGTNYYRSWAKGYQKAHDEDWFLHQP